MLITGPDAQMIADLKLKLQLNFKLKDVGAIKYFLGLEIVRLKHEMTLNQQKYALKLISEAGLLDAKPDATPMEQHLHLTLLVSVFALSSEILLYTFYNLDIYLYLLF